MKEEKVLRIVGAVSGFLNALTFILAVLKLCGVVNCAWWLVLMPAGICIIAALGLLVIFVIALIVVAIDSYIVEHKDNHQCTPNSLNIKVEEDE